MGVKKKVIDKGSSKAAAKAKPKATGKGKGKAKALADEVDELMEDAPEDAQMEDVQMEGASQESNKPAEPSSDDLPRPSSPMTSQRPQGSDSPPSDAAGASQIPTGRFSSLVKGKGTMRSIKICQQVMLFRFEVMRTIKDPSKSPPNFEADFSDFIKCIQNEDKAFPNDLFFDLARNAFPMLQGLADPQLGVDAESIKAIMNAAGDRVPNVTTQGTVINNRYEKSLVKRILSEYYSLVLDNTKVVNAAGAQTAFANIGRDLFNLIGAEVPAHISKHAGELPEGGAGAGAGIGAGTGAGKGAGKGAGAGVGAGMGAGAGKGAGKGASKGGTGTGTGAGVGAGTGEGDGDGGDDEFDTMAKSRRTAISHTGAKNYNNTCYRNTLHQMLKLSDGVVDKCREVIRDNDLNMDSELGLTTARYLVQIRDGQVADGLKTLAKLERLVTKNETIIGIRKSGGPNFAAGTQQDPTEYFQLALGHILQGSDGIQRFDLLESLNVRQVQCIICGSCGSARNDYVDVTIHCIEFPQNNGEVHLVNAMLPTLTRNPDPRACCMETPGCTGGSWASSERIEALPGKQGNQDLLIKFGLTALVSGRETKKDLKVIIPTEPVPLIGLDQLYLVVAKGIHLGVSAYRGHYICYTRKMPSVIAQDLDKESKDISRLLGSMDQWTCFDDETLTLNVNDEDSNSLPRWPSKYANVFAAYCKPLTAADYNAIASCITARSHPKTIAAFIEHGPTGEPSAESAVYRALVEELTLVLDWVAARLRQLGPRPGLEDTEFFFFSEGQNLSQQGFNDAREQRVALAGHLADQALQRYWGRFIENHSEDDDQAGPSAFLQRMYRSNSQIGRYLAQTVVDEIGSHRQAVIAHHLALARAGREESAEVRQSREEAFAAARNEAYMERVGFKSAMVEVELREKAEADKLAAQKAKQDAAQKAKPGTAQKANEDAASQKTNQDAAAQKAKPDAAAQKAKPDAADAGVKNSRFGTGLMNYGSLFGKAFAEQKEQAKANQLQGKVGPTAKKSIEVIEISSTSRSTPPPVPSSDPGAGQLGLRSSPPLASDALLPDRKRGRERGPSAGTNEGSRPAKRDKFQKRSEELALLGSGNPQPFDPYAPDSDLPVLHRPGDHHRSEIGDRVPSSSRLGALGGVEELTALTSELGIGPGDNPPHSTSPDPPVRRKSVRRSAKDAFGSEELTALKSDHGIEPDSTSSDPPRRRKSVRRSAQDAFGSEELTALKSDHGIEPDSTSSDPPRRRKSVRRSAKDAFGPEEPRRVTRPSGVQDTTGSGDGFRRSGRFRGSATVTERRRNIRLGGDGTRSVGRVVGTTRGVQKSISDLQAMVAEMSGEMGALSPEENMTSVMPQNTTAAGEQAVRSEESSEETSQDQSQDSSRGAVSQVEGGTSPQGQDGDDEEERFAGYNTQEFVVPDTFSDEQESSWDPKANKTQRR